MESKWRKSESSGGILSDFRRILVGSSWAWAAADGKRQEEVSRIIVESGGWLEEDRCANGVRFCSVGFKSLINFDFLIH